MRIEPLDRYYAYNRYLKELFGERVQKISLDAGLGCPNRDGALSSRGCIFCDYRGSGSGALIEEGLSIRRQVERGIAFASRRYKARKYIAYFQSFTNTYAPVMTLKALYDTALEPPGMVGLSVGTRPDCAGEEVLDLLASYGEDYLVWVEFGLQSVHETTLEFINRGHDAPCFADAAKRAAGRGLNVCAHIILGLPGETREMMLETARFVAGLPVGGIKIHALYVTEGTEIADFVKRNNFQCLSQDEYAELVIDVLEVLPKDRVIQRLTGDPPRGLTLMAPHWAGDKGGTLGKIIAGLERRETWQGKGFLSPAEVPPSSS